MNHEIKKKYTLNQIIFLGILLLALIPIFYSFNSSKFILFGIQTTWLLYHIIKSKKIRLENLIRIFISILLVLLAYIGGNISIGNRYLILSTLLLLPMIYEVSKKQFGHDSLVKLVLLTTPLLIFTNIYTVIRTMQNPYISRMINYNSYLLLRQGLGGYSYVYSMMFIVFASIMYLLYFKKKKRTEKYLIILLLITGVILILVTNFLTAIALLVIFIIITTFTSFNTKNKQILVPFFCSILLLIWLFWGQSIELYLTRIIIRFSGNGRIARVLINNSFGNSIGSIWHEFTIDRLPTIVSSINGLKTHPILGLALTVDVDSLGYFEGFGNHSLIVDTLALYGIPIGVIYTVLLFKPFFKKNLMKKNNKAITVPFLVCAIIFCLVNNMNVSIGYACYFYGFVFISKLTQQ